MKLPEFEKCKCCKIRKLNNGDIRLCCEPLFLEYVHTTCEERRTEHPEQCKEIFDKIENDKVYEEEYTCIPITIMKPYESATSSFLVMVEQETEYASFVADVIGRLDYDETLMVKVGESEIPFKIIHIGISDNIFPIRFELMAKQVGTFSTGRWEKILKGISNENKR
jgi:hypothetical protein|nr:MAG TPA: hypothetical protein [Caudoviricetes sp.]